MISHFIEKKAIQKIVCKEIAHYSIYNLSYNKEIKSICKPDIITPYTFKIKINISKYDKYVCNIGSFIKTIVNFFDNINPLSILLVIDMSNLHIYDLCIKQFINKLIWSSDAHIFYIDFQIIVNPRFFEIDDYTNAKPYLDKININISTQDLFSNDIPIHCNPNIFQEYNHNNYLYFDYVNKNSINIWYPIIYQYANQFISFALPNNLKIIVHLEKISNVHQLYNILQSYKLASNCYVYIEYSKNDYIVNLCNTYGIKVIEKVDEFNDDYLIAINLDTESDIINQNNITTTNSVFVCSFEPNGIPDNLLKLCKNKLKLKSRCYVDAIATLSTILFF